MLRWHDGSRGNFLLLQGLEPLAPHLPGLGNDLLRLLELGVKGQKIAIPFALPPESFDEFPTQDLSDDLPVPAEGCLIEGNLPLTEEILKAGQERIVDLKVRAEQLPCRTMLAFLVGLLDRREESGKL